MTRHRHQQEDLSADVLGIVIASICLVHCVGLSLLAVFVPWLLSRLGLGTGFHQALAFLALFIGVATLLPGYQRHGKVRVLILGGSGLLLLLLGALIPQDLCCVLWIDSPDVPLTDRLTPLTVTVTLMTPIGCCFLVSAHLMNRRSCQRCRRKSQQFPN